MLQRLLCFIHLLYEFHTPQPIGICVLHRTTCVDHLPRSTTCPTNRGTDPTLRIKQRTERCSTHSDDPRQHLDIHTKVCIHRLRSIQS